VIILGLWLAIGGYALAYAGVQKLGGDKTYSIGDALRGKTPQAQATTNSGPGTGTTQLERAQSAAGAQTSTITTQPVTM
jgi:hypothetical protein